MFQKIRSAKNPITISKTNSQNTKNRLPLNYKGFTNAQNEKKLSLTEDSTSANNSTGGSSLDNLKNKKGTDHILNCIIIYLSGLKFGKNSPK